MNNKKQIVDEFFRLNKQISNGTKNESVDGTGIMASVTDEIGGRISNFIYKNFIYKNFNKDKETLLLDVGCGQGFLIKNMNNLPNVSAYGFEGSIDLLPYFKSDNICIFDLGGDMPNELYKAFDITTSFEMIEHVPMKYQKKVWDNLKYLSDYHICSIHKCPPSHDIHPTILTNSEWRKFFSDNNIEIIEEIPQTTWNNECALWECSFYFILKF